MSLARLALCLTLLVPSLGFAQPPEEWKPYTPPAVQGEPPPPLVPAPGPAPTEASPSASPPEPSPPAPAASRPAPQAEVIPRSAVPEDQTALRLVVTPWAGVVTGLMGLIAGVVPSALIAMPFCLGTSRFDTPGCAVSFTAGMALSYSLGITLGVTFVGNRLGGHGDGVATFLGALGGAALGGGLGVSTHNTGVLVLGLALAPLVGAVLSYEASQSLTPVVSTTARGSILGGLAGRF